MTIDSVALNCYNPLSFKFCAVCIGIAMYFVAVIYFQPCEPRTDFLLPCLFFHLDKSSPNVTPGIPVIKVGISSLATFQKFAIVLQK